MSSSAYLLLGVSILALGASPHAAESAVWTVDTVNATTCTALATSDTTGYVAVDVTVVCGPSWQATYVWNAPTYVAYSVAPVGYATAYAAYPGGYYGPYAPPPVYYPAAATGAVYGAWGSTAAAGRGAAWADPWTGDYGRAGEGVFYNEATGGRGYGYAARNTNAYTGETRAAAGGVRHNPETGRAVAGEGRAVGDVYTGEGAVAGHSVSSNAQTGRVSRHAGAAGRTTEGAAAAGAFESHGTGGDVAGAGYARYDRDTGQLSRGGVAEVNGDVYAGRDGQIYRQTETGWEQAGRGREARRERTAGGGYARGGGFTRSGGGRRR